MKLAQQSKVGPSTPPPWVHLEPFIGQRISLDGPSIQVWMVERGRPDALAEYLASA